MFRSLMTMTYPKCQFIAWNERRKPFLLRDTAYLAGYRTWSPFLSHFFLFCGRSFVMRSKRERERESGSVHNWKISSFRFIYLARNERTNKLFCWIKLKCLWMVRMYRFRCLRQHRNSAIYIFFVAFYFCHFLLLIFMCTLWQCDSYKRKY